MPAHCGCRCKETSLKPLRVFFVRVGSMLPSRYQIFRVCLIAFLCGVAVSYGGLFDLFGAYLFLLLVGCIAILGRRVVGMRYACIIAVCFSLGMIRVFVGGSEEVFPMARTPFSFEGRIVQDPAFYGSRQILTIDAVEKGGVAHGILRVAVLQFPAYRIGQKVHGSCSSLKEAQRSGQSPMCSYASIASVEKERIALRGVLAEIRDFFGDAIRAGLPRPQSDLLGGLLIGAHGAFSSELAGAFRTAGLSHIVAVSGSNISIVIAGLGSVFLKGRIGRKKSFWLLVVGVILFVLFTGATSATVRAGVMGLVVLCAQYLGRLSRSVTALIGAAAVMVLVRPDILLFNVGFQLSCLATLGLIVLSPHILTRISIIPTKGGLRDVVAQTLSALVFTAPLIVAVFQSFSVVGLLANILVVPLIPIIMAVGFGWSVIAAGAFGIQGIVHISLQPLVVVLGTPVYGFLSYVIHVASFLASVPYSSVTVDVGVWTPPFLVASYVVLALTVWRLKLRDQP